MTFSAIVESLGALVLLQARAVVAQTNASSSNETGYASDPFLQYQPHFSLSLPVQLLFGGIVLTLTTTLLIQLCFTWQYHWPLARVNWILQFTAVCTLLLNIMANLYVVLTALAEKSKQWPYMFEYVAIDVPRVSAWTTPEVAAWYVMEAGTSALASITHIQFLSFLYPSRLEARLVFLLLGPLAVVASIMTLLPVITYSPTSPYSTPANNTASQLNVSSSQSSPQQNISAPTDTHQQQLYDIIDAARNICNLTLSLLFTLSLLIWGFLVNRHSAWRTDGGTAAFGAGALILACISTGLNFLNVLSSSRFEWLSSLLWAVVLWQSFLGWWWWVGSASGIAARELDTERRGRKEKKRAKRRKRKLGSNEEESVTAGTTARLDRWRSSVGATLARRRHPPNEPTPPADSQTSTFQAESIDLTVISSIPSVPGDSPPPDRTSLHISSYSSHFFSAIHRAWRALRQAHVRAARVQAIEQHQIQIQMQLENGHGLGRFPGGPGGEYDIGALRGEGAKEGSDDEVTPPESGVLRRRDGARPNTMWLWWWGPLKRWRLRDSTTY
ncbi:hypothetical protein K439DRAFT_1660817 [Ramaria rubella]|nr:hypothetical protein K439DRAFT_1660817 [Ramaria rubella]